jgi:signal transduction histidine kinase
VGTREAAYAALSEAVLQIASETKLEPVLQKLVDAARELVGARYAAIGVPDGRGGFSRFLTSGITDDEIDAIGPLPRTHGLLGAMLDAPEPYRIDDIRRDPRFEYWPAEHPVMKSFLGVPIVAKGDVLGAFYLTDKIDAATFSDDDLHLIELFAAHAAVAIENASLFERSRELTVVEERNRLARDLHDSVVQTLFSLSLSAEAAKRNGSVDALEKVGELAKHAVAELRSIVFELRPADLAAEGLVPTLVKHTDVLQRVFGQSIHVDVASDRRLDETIELELFRIAQEALSNALKHAQASRVDVRADLDHGRLEISDDGVGFDPAAPAIRARHLGLTSMEERAEGIGAVIEVVSAPGGGTTVKVVLADG